MYFCATFNYEIKDNRYCRISVIRIEAKNKDEGILEALATAHYFIPCEGIKSIMGAIFEITEEGEPISENTDDITYYGSAMIWHMLLLNKKTRLPQKRALIKVDILPERSERD